MTETELRLIRHYIEKVNHIKLRPTFFDSFLLWLESATSKD
jgi:hypothetical protein